VKAKEFDGWLGVLEITFIIWLQCRAMDAPLFRVVATPTLAARPEKDYRFDK
jgi:hypothetical protein